MATFTSVPFRLQRMTGGGGGALLGSLVKKLGTQAAAAAVRSPTARKAIVGAAKASSKAGKKVARAGKKAAKAGKKVKSKAKGVKKGKAAGKKAGKSRALVPASGLPRAAAPRSSSLLSMMGPKAARFKTLAAKAAKGSAKAAATGAVGYGAWQALDAIPWRQAGQAVGKEAVSTATDLGLDYLDRRLRGEKPMSGQDVMATAYNSSVNMTNNLLNSGQPRVRSSVSRAGNNLDRWKRIFQRIKDDARAKKRFYTRGIDYRMVAPRAFGTGGGGARRKKKGKGAKKKKKKKKTTTKRGTVKRRGRGSLQSMNLKAGQARLKRLKRDVFAI